MSDQRGAPGRTDRWARHASRRPLIAALCALAATGCLGAASATPPSSTVAGGKHANAATAPGTAPVALQGWANVNLVSVESIVSVAGAIDRSAKAGDDRAVARGCATMQAALAQARTGGPIPDAEAQAVWNTALDHLALGAGLCVDGVPRSDPSSIVLSAHELAAGLGSLRRLVPDLRAAAG